MLATLSHIMVRTMISPEIPQGLELISKAVEQDEKRFSKTSIVLPSLLRMATGAFPFANAVVHSLWTLETTFLSHHILPYEK